MAPPVDGYELIDAGDGRRLERFGTVVLDRPAPAVRGIPRRVPAAWSAATARFERAEGAPAGSWQPPDAVPARWTTSMDGLVVELRPTPAGGVGLYPEHLEVARWAAARATEARRGAGRVEVLNLFAHTGLVSLLVAAAGARVVHVDASRPAVAWARRNADLAGLADRPIRWIVDDARRFVDREARRGRRYDGVVLDPPTWGHGPRGAPWRLADDLDALLRAIRPLLAASWFAACTAHATELRGDDLGTLVGDPLGAERAGVAVRSLALEARSGARLPAGWAVLATSPRPRGGERGGPRR